MRNFAAIIFATLVSSFFAFLFLFHAIYSSTLTDSHITYKPGNRISKVNSFPEAGSEIKLKPPWDIPEVTAIQNASFYLENSGPYIISNFSFSAGQGNLMFQYATLVALSKQINATLLIPENLLLRRAFELHSCTFVSPKVLDELLSAWPQILFADCCRFYTESQHLRINRASIVGYFQSWRYFDSIEEQIKKEFQFLPPVRDRALTLLEEALRSNNRSADDVTLVGVHVRRGMDVLWNVKNKEHGHQVADEEYLETSMRYFRTQFPNVLFVVCSDDIVWCKKNLAAKDVLLISGEEREVDMAILQNCHHTVMTTGTFSWWAAYLKTDGTTLYYKGWPRPGSKMDKMLVRQDYFLPEWLGL